MHGLGSATENGRNGLGRCNPRCYDSLLRIIAPAPARRGIGVSCDRRCGTLMLAYAPAETRPYTPQSPRRGCGGDQRVGPQYSRGSFPAMRRYCISRYARIAERCCDSIMRSAVKSPAARARAASLRRSRMRACWSSRVGRSSFVVMLQSYRAARGVSRRKFEQKIPLSNLDKRRSVCGAFCGGVVATRMLAFLSDAARSYGLRTLSTESQGGTPAAH